MNCGNNNGLWLIIILIILFCGNGWGCGSTCGSTCNTCNPCGC